MPLRLVPDTNVLISALLWEGRARAILDAANNGLADFYSSGPLIAELEEKLGHAKFAPRINAMHESPVNLLNRARAVLTVIEVEDSPVVAVRDPDDLVVLATAFAARAEVLVTQDKDLLELRQVLDLTIMNVDEVFWTLGLPRL